MEDTAAGPRVGGGCPHCHRPVEASWKFCPYCARSTDEGLSRKSARKLRQRRELPLDSRRIGDQTIGGYERGDRREQREKAIEGDPGRDDREVVVTGLPPHAAQQ